MSTFWKIMIGLMVTLPVGAYVAGNLAGAMADGPAPHGPIVIRDARTTPLPDPSQPAGGPTTPAHPDSRNDGDDDSDGDGDDDIEVVRPQPDDVDDVDDDADEVGGDGTDDSAPDDRTDGDTDSGGNDD